MKTIFVCFAVGLYTFGCCAQLNYPNTPKIEVSDTLWRTIYKDNYRWMENMKDPKVVDWFKDQATLTDSVMGNISGRDELIAEWRKLEALQPPSYSHPFEAGGRFFYQIKSPDEQVSRVYFREGLNGADQLLFNPLTFIDGKIVSVGSIKPSSDGKKLLISYSEDGSEIFTLQVIDVDTKKMLPDSIPATAGAGDWSADNTSFLYGWLRSTDNMDPNAFLSPKYKLHKLGTDAATDIDFFSNESYPSLNIDPGVFPSVFMSKFEKRYVFAQENTVQRELKMYYAPVNQFYSGTIQWKTLCEQKDMLLDLQFFDDKIIALTYRDAPNYKLVATDLKHPDWDNAEIIMPEKTMRIASFGRSKDFILINYSDGITNEIVKYNPKTKESTTIKLPFEGNVYFGRIDALSNNYLFYLTSWNKSFTQFLFDAETETFSESPFSKPTEYPDSYKDLVVEEVEVKGHDGVMVPLSIIYKKGLKKDGRNVCIMEGYGAYGYSISPSFNVQLNSLATKGAVIAIAHVRGGGEKGEDWYRAGYKQTKPNTWKDFISCAEYLIAKGYTSADKLAGTGTSGGGVLITRAITERPDLFAAAVCNVGMGNPMRSEFYASGPSNIPEFGTVKDSLDTKALYEMDGMQHVKEGVNYPALMCVAGWNDPRVVVWDPGKFLAAVQNASTSGKPALMKVNYGNGHFTEDTEVTWANFADQYAFMMWQCGHPDFQVKTDKN